MKKLLSVLSSTLQGGIRGGFLILALLATTSLWAYDYDFEHNEIRYKIISDEVANHTVEVVGSYTNYATHFTIPQTVIHGAAAYEVIRIGDEAFDNHKTIAVIELPNSITSIGYKAFYNSTLKEIVIPESVTDIEEYAFGSCSKLTSVTISDGVTSIGNNAFSYCSSLTSITIPNSVTNIGSYAFRNCSITSITIPESVTYIGSYAFLSSTLTSIIWNAKNCNDFRDDPNHIYDPNFTIFGKNDYVHTIIFGENVEYIPEHLCYDMNSLKSITIPESVTSIGYGAYNWCTSLASVTLGNSVTNIGGYAFSNCALTSITIPESVTSIGYAAFACSSLTSVVWNAKNCESVSELFGVSAVTSASNNNIIDVVFGDSVEHIPAYLFMRSKHIKEVTIPNSVHTIGEGAFSNCSSLTSATIGNSVTNIGNRAFSGCSSLTSITIPNSVTSIGDGAFSGCSSLSSITIPDSITSIGEDAFYGCSSLTDITIPNSVTSIGDNAFSYCSSLTSVTIPNSVTSIGDHAFYDCTSLVSVVWNATNYTSDAYYVFDSDTPYQITSFVFGDSVKYIPSFLCGGMSSLTSITIPNSVTSIGDKAFSGCSSLSSITIPNSVTSIGEYAFRGCESLSSVVIGNSVTKIRTETFKDCSSLTSVTIGKKVKEIGTDAFYGCSALAQTNYTGDIAGWCQMALGSFSSNPTYYSKNLFINGEEVKDVVIPNTVTSISNCAFYNCVGISSLTIPESVKSIGYNAFGGCKKLFDIYCYPTTPPEAQESSFANYNVNLYVPCESLKDYQMDMVFGSFKYIQCLEDTPPSEPQDTTIYHPTEDATICEGDEYYWRGMQITEAGTYTYEEIVEDENYIYHNIYTLELTVIPFSSDTIVVEAYDSYEWHGRVYTESGVYLYEEYCYQEILELTIIPLEDKEYVYGTYYQDLVCNGGIYVDPITGENHLISSLDPTSLTWSDTVKGTEVDTIHTFNITPIVYPEPLTEDMLYAIGAVPKLVAGEKVDLMGTTELIMAYYQMVDQHDIADVIGVEWVLGHDVVLDAEQTTHTMVLEVMDECDDIIPVEYTFPVSKKDSEPQDTTIYIYHTEDVTICEGETYIWWGMEFTETGTYTYASKKIVEEDDYIYIYHNIYTLHLMVLPPTLDMYEVTAYDSYEWHGVVYTESGVYTYRDPYNPCVIEELHLTIIDTPTPPSELQDTIYYADAICEGETYIWWGMEFTETGTYTCIYEEIVEDEDYTYIYRHLHILYLTVLPYETIEYEVEAYDSFEWHGIVYTESGTYTYQYECTTEVLYLTIIPSQDNQGEVVVEPSTNSVTITWQKEDDADTYIIVIKQGDKVVCTLIFDAEGNLVSVNYLPGRKSNKHGIQHAGLTSDSFQYTITGLTPSTDYTYTVTATDDSDNTISSYSGEFTTHHATSVENTNTQLPTSDCQKILYEDHIYILRDGKIYSIMGQEM